MQKKKNYAIMLQMRKPGADVPSVLKIIYYVMQKKMYLQKFYLGINTVFR